MRVNGRGPLQAWRFGLRAMKCLNDAQHSLLKPLLGLGFVLQRLSNEYNECINILFGVLPYASKKCPRLESQLFNSSSA